ncbi:hypothetical protein JCM30237_28460 [Halolamina litorea]|uniref:AbrB/MazE/SpoVT family DNA-binding domain-containing protein n=1 Tax=Halolamina litorea TaxID=1515593 RepID=A0ABD6BU52_9EURY|nr:AbrB/MazE/SpoVT family DNA-binding domain-containing protein [Halolamina litorea]
METRKLQRVGGGTITVSLPKEWADRHGLDAGDTVDVHGHVEDVLTIQPDGLPAEDGVSPTVRVVDDCTPESLRRTLQAAYAAGAASVTFRAENTLREDQRRAVESTARARSGLTVDAASAEALTVRCLLDPAELSIQQSVRQLQFVALSSVRRAAEAIRAGEEGVTVEDGQPDRIRAAVERSFRRGLTRLDELDTLGVDRTTLFELRETARSLATVAEAAEDLAAAAGAEGAATLTDSVSLAVEVVEDAVAVVLDDGPAREAHRALAAREALADELGRVEDSLGDRVDPRLIRAIDAVDTVAAAGATIAREGLGSAVRNGTVDGSVPAVTDAAERVPDREDADS